jgi:hypothetical protein
MQLKTLAFLLLVAFAASVEFNQESKIFASKYLSLHLGIPNRWLDKKDNRMESYTFATNVMFLPDHLPVAPHPALQELPRLEAVVNHWASELQGILAALDARLIISATLYMPRNQQHC